MHDDVLCIRCYKYANKLLKSDACTLSSQDILAELKVKETKLKEQVEGLSSTASEDHIALCRALHADSIVIADQAFLCTITFFSCCLVTSVRLLALPKVGF